MGYIQIESGFFFIFFQISPSHYGYPKVGTRGLGISLDQCGVGGAAAKMPPSRAPSGNDGADSMFGAILK